VRFLALIFIIGFAARAGSAAPLGYYRQPTIHGDTIVFVAEGDLWRVSAAGGLATRLTSHPAEENSPAISPDGSTVAFIGHYEGPPEVYTMPLAGGQPTRRTYDGENASVAGWTRDGKILVATSAHSTLPDLQLVMLDISSKDVAAVRTIVPLAQAADGCFDDKGKTLFFTRLPHQGSHTKRYKGGTGQNIWKYADGADEAVPLTSDYAGASKRPMWWGGRIYFASDRDGTMNLWSMKPDGSDLKQHTHHAGWDIASPSLSDGRIVYQLGADLHLYDIAANRDRLLPITLESDFDQTREHWVKKPLDYLTAAHISPDGQMVTLTARGRVFAAPRHAGRFVEVTHGQGMRYRDARYLDGGKEMVALSDESGEIELCKLPANGVGNPQQLTKDGTVLRWEAVPSPDGKLIAHHDKDQRLFIYDVEKQTNRKIDESRSDAFSDLRWSPDSKWLAYARPSENMFRQLRLYSIATGAITDLTGDRFDSFSPAWGADGKWLYFLSDRSLKSVVEEPWGTYQPEPFLDKRTLIYAIALTESETHSPFAPDDELHGDGAKQQPATKPAGPVTQPAPQSKPAPQTEIPDVRIDLQGIATRLIKLPLSAGNYSELAVNEKSLFWLAATAGQKKNTVMGVDIGNDNLEPKTIVGDVKSFELSQDGTSLLVLKGEEGPNPTEELVTTGLFVIDATVGQADLAKKDVDLSNWGLSVVPRDEWRWMLVDAWRLERDYFYDRNMHGVDWKAVRAKYQPLADRVTDRAELADLIGQMVSELSALHTFVFGGDRREGQDTVTPASLGAVLSRDPPAGGYRVEHIYRSDPDEPETVAPLAKLGVGVEEGDVIVQVNGQPTLDAPDVGALLRRRGDQQVLLHIKPKKEGPERDVIVTPLSADAAENLRYRQWEYTRRLEVEDAGKGQIGYVHLRAMGTENFSEWAKGFYPAWNRQGLIIDVRHNGGGNIDSWIIGRLLRKAWFYWSDRVNDRPMWNMQYAFRGHVVVLCDEFTMSDGEAFTEGIKRLKLGEVIGSRTWGGEIWLSFSNLLVDRGIASAAENGVYGPEGKWLIEGHGVDPDVVVDNLPHATFKGDDAQLKAAIAHLQKMMKEKPVEQPRPPAYPNKSK
ncbi:MAG: protease, partial [Phycisphaerales bacterium]|nr:protease [Phycisphaerales bacterium]